MNTQNNKILRRKVSPPRGLQYTLGKFSPRLNTKVDTTPPPAPEPVPFVITIPGIEKDLERLVALPKHNLNQKQKDEAYDVSWNMLHYAVGDTQFHPFLKNFLGMLAKDPGGFDVVNRLLQKPMSGNFARVNEMTTFVEKSGVFNISRQELTGNYKKVSQIVGDVIKDASIAMADNYKTIIPDKITAATNALKS